MSFNTPILLIVFNRPDKTKELIKILENICPKKLFVSADGPRQYNESDKILCKEVREIFDNLPWECEVIKKFSETNLSCKKNVITSINWFFDINERGIILEDDCIPSKTFFLFCEKLLQKYVSEDKIMQINGFNGGLKYSDLNNASYFFSKLSTTWGWATWKRAWKKFDENFQDFIKLINDKKIQDYYENQDIAKWMEKYFVKSIEKQDNIWSTGWSYTILRNDGLCISPLNNLIKNIGFDDTATSGMPKTFSKYSMPVDDSFKIDKFASKITYNKFNDEKYFYDLIQKIDPRAKNDSIFQKVKKYFKM